MTKNALRELRDGMILASSGELSSAETVGQMTERLAQSWLWNRRVDFVESAHRGRVDLQPLRAAVGIFARRVAHLASLADRPSERPGDGRDRWF